MSKIAIIGTAGRDKTKPMTKELWDWMVADAKSRTGPGDHLVSGGAAWADHLAVRLFLDRHVKGLTLHLPAPLINGNFIGPYRSAASAANYYHDLFSRVIDEDTRMQIQQTESLLGVEGTFEPEAEGYAAMFTRNKKVAAAADLMLAYTFGEGNVPADGGTKDTWDQCRGKRIHITLPTGMQLHPLAKSHLVAQMAREKGLTVIDVPLSKDVAPWDYPTVKWARTGGYECSSKGDGRYSAFNAVMPDGRTIEQHYQCDVKGYQPGGTDWRLGKGKPPLNRNKDLWEEYLGLWKVWAQNHVELMQKLRTKAAEHNNTLSDMFATTPVNQARALTELLNQGF